MRQFEYDWVHPMKTLTFKVTEMPEYLRLFLSNETLTLKVTKMPEY